MSLTFACGHCGKTFTLDDQFAGKKGRCDECGALMLIPSSGPAAPPRKSVERKIAPTVPARAPAPALPIEEPLRRVSVRAEKPANPKPDVYGFDDVPMPPRSKVIRLEEEDFAISQLETLSPIRARPVDPTSRKKSKSNDSTNPGLQLVGRIAFGIAFLACSLTVKVLISGTAGSWLPNFKTKSGLEAILNERVQLFNELSDRLALVNSVPEALEASSASNQHARAITKNLVKLRTATGSVLSVQELKERYAALQKDAVVRFLQEILRVKAMPDVWQALNLEAAIEEMAAEEAATPGLQQVQVTDLANPAPPPGRFNAPEPPGFNQPAPPGFNPPIPPVPNPGFNNRPRPGSFRGGAGRMGPGGRPDAFGPR